MGDQKHRNNVDSDNEDSGNMGPFKLMHEDDWLTLEDREHVRTETRCNVRYGKRPGWQEWMWTLHGPVSQLKVAKQMVKDMFIANRQKERPKKVEVGDGKQELNEEKPSKKTWGKAKGKGKRKDNEQWFMMDPTWARLQGGWADPYCNFAWMYPQTWTPMQMQMMPPPQVMQPQQMMPREQMMPQQQMMFPMQSTWFGQQPQMMPQQTEVANMGGQSWPDSFGNSSFSTSDKMNRETDATSLRSQKGANSKSTPPPPSDINAQVASSSKAKVPKPPKDQTLEAAPKTEEVPSTQPHGTTDAKQEQPYRKYKDALLSTQNEHWASRRSKSRGEDNAPSQTAEAAPKKEEVPSTQPHGTTDAKQEQPYRNYKDAKRSTQKEHCASRRFLSKGRGEDNAPSQTARPVLDRPKTGCWQTSGPKEESARQEAKEDSEGKRSSGSPPWKQKKKFRHSDDSVLNANGSAGKAGECETKKRKSKDLQYIYIYIYIYI